VPPPAALILIAARETYNRSAEWPPYRCVSATTNAGQSSTRRGAPPPAALTFIAAKTHAAMTSRAAPHCPTSVSQWGAALALITASHLALLRRSCPCEQITFGKALKRSSEAWARGRGALLNTAGITVALRTTSSNRSAAEPQRRAAASMRLDVPLRDGKEKLRGHDRGALDRSTISARDVVDQ